MKKKNLPAAPQSQLRQSIAFDLSANALNHWESGIKAAEDEENTISIFDPIGMDYFTGDGVTAKRIAAALRNIGSDKDVTIYINSPGGDMFEGLAIYNLLRNHGGIVTVKVLGIAASAASIIAMAADKLQIANSAFLMIHNCWLCAVGNRHDLREVADIIEPFDSAAADIYASRTGIDIEQIKSLMDKETYINGKDAIEQGFADSLLSADVIDSKQEDKPNALIKKADVLLAKAGLARSERRKFLNELKTSMSCAASESMPCATSETQKTEEPLNIEIGSLTKILKDIEV